MLRIERLCLRRPRFDLGPVSMRIARGEYFGLLGPSGAGKTSLMECVSGFHPAASGQVVIDGVDVSQAPPSLRQAGVVYQDAALFPHLSLGDNLAFPLRIAGADPGAIRRRVTGLAELLGLSDRLDAYPRALSGGEARRGALGRALAADRKLLLLDEPLAALDPGLRRALRTEIAQLHRDLALTVVHVTHDLDEVMALADRVAVLLDGRVAQTGTPREVFTRPASAAVARYLGILDFIEGVADPGGGVIVTSAGPVPAPVDTAGAICARLTGGVLHADSTEGPRGPRDSDGVAVRVLTVDDRRDPPAVIVGFGRGSDTIALEVEHWQGFSGLPSRGTEGWLDLAPAKWRFYRVGESSGATR